MDRIKHILRNEKISATEISRIADDGNSEIYLVNTGGTERIVKLYSESDISRYRLRNEVKGIGIGNCVSLRTPIIYHISSKNNMIVMEYIQGRKIEVLKDWHVEKLARGLWEVRRKNDMSKLWYAKDACLTLKNHYDCTSKRIMKWKKLITGEGKHYPKQLKQFINELDRYMLDQYCSLISKVERKIWIERDKRLEVFSQSDVGKHNLLEKDMILYTIDMEYSGLDDITKNIIDWYLQPDYGMNLEELCKYVDNLKYYEIWTSDVAERIKQVVEIHRIKWALIILNKYTKNESEQLIEKSIKYFHRTKDKVRELSQVI